MTLTGLVGRASSSSTPAIGCQYRRSSSPMGVPGPVWPNRLFLSSLSNWASPMIAGMRADEWRPTGLDEYEIANAVGLRLTPAHVLAWAPLRPLESHWARRHGLSLAEARRWAVEGVPVRDAIHARAVGLGVD